MVKVPNWPSSGCPTVPWVPEPSSGPTLMLVTVKSDTLKNAS